MLRYTYNFNIYIEREDNEKDSYNSVEPYTDIAIVRIYKIINKSNEEI